MVSQLATSAKEHYRLAVDRELAAFEKRENEFNARERKERAAQLGLMPGRLKEAADAAASDGRRGNRREGP